MNELYDVLLSKQEVMQMYLFHNMFKYYRLSKDVENVRLNSNSKYLDVNYTDYYNDHLKEFIIPNNQIISKIKSHYPSYNESIAIAEVSYQASVKKVHQVYTYLFAMKDHYKHGELLEFYNTKYYSYDDDAKLKDWHYDVYKNALNLLAQLNKLYEELNEHRTYLIHIELKKFYIFNKPDDFMYNVVTFQDGVPKLLLFIPYTNLKDTADSLPNILRDNLDIRKQITTKLKSLLHTQIVLKTGINIMFTRKHFDTVTKDLVENHRFVIGTDL
jgi:hypothetical protein